MRIALINSPTLQTRPVSRSMAGGLGFDGHEGMVLPPLDLAYLAATLRHASHHVELVDADPLRLNAQGVLARLSSGLWDVLIGTVSLPSLDHDASFLSELRKAYPHTKVIAKTMIRDRAVLETLLKKSGATLVLHGEADLTITDIVSGASRSGTAWLEPDAAGFRFMCEEGTPVADLNQLPLPARDLLPNDRYSYPLLGSPVATLQTSRGCPFPCGFYCPYPLVEGVKWRAQSPERIAMELRDVVERLGIRKIYFRDATFTLNQERVAALCDLIVAAEWRLEWVCETRVDCLSDSLLEKMKGAGCVGILIGVETGDEQVMQLREGKKGLTVPKLAHIRERARALDIRMHVLLIVGLPQETRESIVATYDLIQRYRPDTIGVTIITPYPGTPLYEQGLREGWVDSLQWQDYGGHQVPMHTPHMTREELIAGKRFIEEGFAILQRFGVEQTPALQQRASRHYESLLRWAYRLDEPVAQIRRAIDSAPRSAPAPSLRPVAQKTAEFLPPSRFAMSVVIPTYNRRAILRKTLLAFGSQTLGADQFEVIVVDDGSSDDTVTMVRQFKAPFTLRLLTPSHGGANAARNLGIRAAEGKVVLITGDDMIPEPSFLEAHAGFHERRPDELDAMLGFIDWSPEITITPFMRFIVSPEGGQQFAFHEVRDGKADFRLFYTSNLSVKRDLLLKQPVLFDEDFSYPAYDDAELGYRLSRQGLQLHYNPRAVTCHHHEIAVEQFVQRQRKAGHMGMLFGRKHPELDRAYLQLSQALQARESFTEHNVRRILQVAQELEKPDVSKLAALRHGGEGFDRTYITRVLYPVYQTVLQLAYGWGVCEAESREAEATRSVPAVIPHRYKASIIIPVFNKCELTQQCLTRLAAVTSAPDYEVIVVDNASTDGTTEFLSQLGGDIRVIRNQENLGFAKACNRGARVARGEYLVFLNNDTIPTEGWLAAMVDEVERHRDVAVVGSKLLYEDGTIQHAGVVFSRIVFTPYHLYRKCSADAPMVNRRREFQCVTAACMLVRRNPFEEVGGFDEGYQNGFEDVDLCLKIRERGGRIIYRPDSVVYHLESQTPGRKAHDNDNARRLLERWSSKWWIPDEDAVYFEDGIASETRIEQGMLYSQFRYFTSSEDRAQWRLLADTQIAAQAQDIARIKRNLAVADRWPNDFWALRWAALVCTFVEAPELAPPFWHRIVAIDPDPEALVALAKVAIEAGRLDEAERHLARLLQHHPHHGDGWVIRGILSMQREFYGEARQAFEHALVHGGDRRKAGIGLGMAAMGLKNQEQAWKAFLEVLASAPDDGEAIHWLVRAGTALERWDQLSDEVRRFLLRNPADATLRLALAGILIRAGQHEAARGECDSLRLLHPECDGLQELATLLNETSCELSSSHRS